MVPAERLSKALVHDTLRPPTARRAYRIRLVRFALSWGLLTAVALWAVGGFARATMANYQIDNLRASYQAAVAEHQSLEIAAARLESPGRLETVAASLHLTSPGWVLVVHPAAADTVARSDGGSKRSGFLQSIAEGAVKLIAGDLGDAVGTW